MVFKTTPSEAIGANTIDTLISSYVNLVAPVPHDRIANWSKLWHSGIALSAWLLYLFSCLYILCESKIINGTESGQMAFRVVVMLFWQSGVLLLTYAWQLSACTLGRKNKHNISYANEAFKCFFFVLHVKNHKVWLLFHIWFATYTFLADNAYQLAIKNLPLSSFIIDLLTQNLS